MKKFVVHRNLHIDPLTRLKNFVQFLEEDYRNLFGEKGTICVFDIGSLREVNRFYGREVGDQLIVSASKALCDAFPRDKVFRTEGDAFTIVLKDTGESKVNAMIKESCEQYAEAMSVIGHEDSNLHVTIYPYMKPIKSIEDFYMFVVKEEVSLTTSSRYSGDDLVRHILSGVINRFRLSLEYYEEVYNYALIDEVSGLPNAKAANQYLASMVSHTGRRTDQYCILFIDGDDLRRYNDISYETGNDMIRSVADGIKESSRQNDKIFRWLSGDEFIVVLENADHQTGEGLAERIRSTIEEKHLDAIFNTTVSIGVASYPTDGRDVDTVIYYAEKATKVAKEQGKNQVVCWRDVDVSVL